MTAFQVQLDCFQGPLDLLLYLVRQQEVDLLEVALAEVANQYREMVETLAVINIDQVGDFLVMASTLMELKSRLLLPREEEIEEAEEEEGTAGELVRQLLEYKRFKEAGALLRERANTQQQKLKRIAEDLPPLNNDPAIQPIREVELWDLVSAFGRLMREAIVPITDTVLIDPTPMSVYMERLEEKILTTGGIGFRELMGDQNTKPQLIVKFLALLELIKLKRVWVDFDDASDDLFVQPPRPQQMLGIADEEEQESMAMADETVPPDVRDSRPDAGDGGPDGMLAEETDDMGETDETDDISDANELPPTIAAAHVWSETPQRPSSPGQEVPSAWADFEPIIPLEEPGGPAGTDHETQQPTPSPWEEPDQDRDSDGSAAP